MLVLDAKTGELCLPLIDAGSKEHPPLTLNILQHFTLTLTFTVLLFSHPIFVPIFTYNNYQVAFCGCYHLASNLLDQT